MSRRMDQGVAWLALVQETEPLAALSPISVDRPHMPVEQRMALERKTGRVMLTDRYPDHRRADLPTITEGPTIRPTLPAPAPDDEHVPSWWAEHLPMLLIVALAVWCVVRWLY